VGCCFLAVECLEAVSGDFWWPKWVQSGAKESRLDYPLLRIDNKSARRRRSRGSSQELDPHHVPDESRNRGADG